MYGAGAAIGFTPQQVDDMSLWQFVAAYSGYVKANSASGPKLTEGQKDDLFDWLEAADSDPQWLTTQTYWWDGALPVPKGRVRFRVG